MLFFSFVSHGINGPPRPFVEHVVFLIVSPWLHRRTCCFSFVHHGYPGERFGVRQIGPFLVRAHQRDHAAAGIGRGLEGFAVPLSSSRVPEPRRVPRLAAQKPCRRRRGDA